jgi:hypothetical protein
MNNANKPNWDRYSNGHWSELHREARLIKEEYERGGHSEATKHRLVDSAREIQGGVRTASVLIPVAMAEHKRGIEWGLERLLVSMQQLENAPHIDPGEHQALKERIASVIGMIDRDDLDAAENGVRDIEVEIERLQTASLETEFASLMTSIGAMYQPTVQ